MRSLLLFLPLLTAFAQGEEPKPLQGQKPFTEDEVYTTVGKMQTDQDNWIGYGDVIVDHEGYVWLKAEAKVQSQKMAAFFSKSGELVRVKKTEKGLTIVIGPTQQWEIVQRSTLKASDVLPCMSWSKQPQEVMPLKKLKGGLQ